ncbi:MAG: carboxypeptidase-like regulatory domain-containing protein, partial [Blastocatellia bacterium]
MNKVVTNKSTKSLLVIGVLVIAGLLWVPMALGQTASTGALSGTVTDPAGAVVTNVQIKVTNEATGEMRTARTRGDGNYAVPLLPPGAYRVEAAAAGFKNVVRTNLRVNVTETATLDIKLEVGVAGETVTITAAPSVVLGGWSLTGVTTIQSGQWLTITATNSNNVFGIAGDRAQLAAGCTYSQIATSGSVTSKLNNYFNRACFAPFPVIGDDGRGTTFGNSGVGIVTGPAQNNVDLAIIKRTKLRWLGEASNLEFRTEFFNAFNTPQFSAPDSNFSSGSFGQISTTSVNPRIMQFALKLN